MIVTPGKALGDLATKLALSVAPETTSTYAMANAGMISVLLVAISQDSERAIANRLADIEEIKAIFAQADDAPDPGGRFTFSSRAPDSLHLSDVMTHHAEGLNLLIELHTWAETNDSQLDEAIWTFLLNHTEREKFEW